MYELNLPALTVLYDPETFTLEAGRYHWKGIPYFVLADGTRISFGTARCETSEYETGVSRGVRAEYSGFRTPDGKTRPYVISTYVYADLATGDLCAEAAFSGDAPGEIHSMAYPPRFAFDEGSDERYTVLPRMQGALLRPSDKLTLHEARVYQRVSYVPMYGQTDEGEGYLAIYDTPYDAVFDYEDNEVQPIFIPSLGLMGEPRRMRYSFCPADCDYNMMAKRYRYYMEEHGQAVTLRAKIAQNPKAEYLIGCPIVTTAIAIHISPDSDYYSKDHPEQNDHHTSFAERAKQLRELKKRGVRYAYLHLDGWGRHGYDNLHPDPFPPHEESGGWAGMRLLQQTCTELEYMFGIHDQYRDYYYDAPTFSLDNAVQNLDGGHPFCSIWFGGKHSLLCAALAPDYVRRNYNTFENNGVRLDGSYLDVFSVTLLDECFNPRHRMTREQCARKRREALDVLTARGIIPSSEEVLGCVVDSQVLCHHIPFYTDKLDNPKAKNVGTPIPLWSLIGHDCLITPWYGLSSHGGWGIAGDERGFLWALLCGDTIYIDVNETEENIRFAQIALQLHDRVALIKLDRHEILDGNPRRRRTVFEDGTVVEADFDTEHFTIRYPDGTTVDETCPPVK